jgi:hypothetical protein
MSEFNRRFEVKYPSIRSAASGASRNFQFQNNFLIFLSLLMLMVSAILSKYSIPGLGFQYSQSTLLVLGIVCTVILTVRKPDRCWYAARSLSETVKTLSWMYIVNAPPFDQRDIKAEAVFQERLEIACNESNRLIGKSYFKLSQCSSIVLSMFRELPLDEKIALYSSERINNQYDWYVRQAKKNKRSSVVFLIALFVANFFAVCFSVYQEYFSIVTPLPTDIFITLAGSVIAWTQAKKFNDLATAYDMASYEINFLRRSIHEVDTSAKLKDYVVEAEAVFSREHTQWGARRS